MATSGVVLGLWPITGITTVGVTRADAVETIETAIECGITTFDTAFSYGYDGESDRLLGEIIRGDRDRFKVIGKVGQGWTPAHERVIDGTPQTLIADAEVSLKRIGIEQFDCLMLHSPDPNVPIETSAAAIQGLQRRGLCSRIGVCNVDSDQLNRFIQAAGCDAIECPLNLMQRQSLDALIPMAAEHRCDVYVYWVLMKGLLAGRIGRRHRFDPADVRPRYEIFQGEARARTHEVLDRIAEIESMSGLTPAQRSIGWALAQPGVTAALVGARRPEQVRQIAAAKPLTPDQVAAIDRIVEACS